MAGPDKIVKTTFKADGNLDRKFTLMERAAARFGRSASKSFRKANRGAKKFKVSTGSIVRGLGIQKGFSLLEQGLGSVVTQFIAFDKAALGATVRFTDIGPKAANFDEQLKRIEKSARDAGSTTQFTAAQAAEGLNFMAKAGFTSTEAMLGLESMINLSIATGEEFNSVADQSSDLLGAFGLAADDAATKIANLNRLNDVLVKTSNSANVNMETMFDTMKIAAPIGTSLGITLEEMAAVTGVLGAAGIKGSQAATALKNSFLNLTTGKKPVVDMLRAIGAEIKKDTKGNFLFVDTIDEIAKKTKDLGKVERTKVFAQIFGKFAVAGAINLGNAVDKIKELEKALKAAGGESKLTAQIMGRALEAKLLVLGSTATEFGFKILSAFRDDASGGIDSLSESIRGLDVGPLITDMKIIAGLAKTVLDVAVGVAKATKATGEFLGETTAKVVSGKVFKTAEGESFSLDDLFTTSQQINQRAADQTPRRIAAPNQKEAEAKASPAFPGFEGQLNIAGAPEGSTMETKAAPPGFSVAILGQN